MATQTRIVPGDLGSDEVTLLRKCLNALVLEITNASTFAALQTAVAANTDIKYVLLINELPKAAHFPDK